MRLEKMFDIHKMLKILRPKSYEFDTILRSAATIGAVQRKSGEYGTPPIPAPVDFVDDLFGYSDPEEPVWNDVYDRNRSVLMLRCVVKMRKYLDNWTLDHTHSLRQLRCPKCSKATIDAVIGPKPIYWKKGGEDMMAVIDMTITCECDGFTIDDMLNLESEALT